MMEFWPEHQGQSPLYSKFGTVPGRNCTQNYHDRHQATQSPFYYGAQQDQSRESSYWTVPGSRTGGSLHDYSNWTDPELSAPTSSHFPFILDRHARQHQGSAEYPPHEARGREWTAAQRVAREYERGFLREGWQRKWEPSNPVRYNREVSTKRSDSSYRELEAWAARYSHSLPRRRHREAEFRGTSNVPLESSRAPERRSGTDPQGTALQQVRQSASFRESWDRGDRQQTPTYYPLQAPAPDTSRVLDTKEKAAYQRKRFSQPPGYIAPPPYNSPHTSSPVIHHCDTGCGQEGKQQHYWSQPTLRKQEACVDVQEKREVWKEDFTKPEVNEMCAELEGLEHRGPGHHAAQAIPAAQETKTNEQTSSKVIEGRKFRLNKKTGGLTIFCLVSRTAGSTETPSLPLCISPADIPTTGVEEGCKDPRDNGNIYQKQKLADEVDFRVPTLTEQSNTCPRNVQAKQRTASSETLSDNLSKKTETGENNNLKDENSTIGRQVTPPVQPVAVKYPLWREPSFTSRTETDSSNITLKANREEVESDDSYNRGDGVRPITVEVRRLDIKRDTQSEDREGRLVIDTTCVVVKMELIPPPAKDQLHHLSSTRHSEDSRPSASAESNPRLNQDVLPSPLETNDRAEMTLESDIEEKEEPEGGADVSFMSSWSIPERETLRERAERILGIPLHDCITEGEGQDATSLLDSCVECDERVEPSPTTTDIHDATEQLRQDTRDEERPQDALEMDQSEDTLHLKESDEEEDELQNEDEKHLAGLEEQVSDMSEERDTESQLQTTIQTAQEDDLFERSQADSEPVEKDPSQHLAQGFSPGKDLPHSFLLSHPDFTSLPHMSQSSTDEGLHPQWAAFATAENLVPPPETSSSLSDAPPQHPSPPPPAPTESSPSSTPHKCHSPIPPPPPPPPPLDLLAQMPESMSGVDDLDEEGDTLQLVRNEMSEPKDLGEQQQLESEQPHNAPCVEENNSSEEQQAKEADREITDVFQQCLEISRQQQQCLCVRESRVTEETEQEEKGSENQADILEMTISQENPTAIQSQMEVEPVLQPFDIVGQEDTNGTESYMINHDQLVKDNSGDTDVSVQTTEKLKEYMSETQVEVKIVQQQSMDVSCVMSPVTEETLQTDEEPSMSHENTTDDQTPAEIEMLVDVEAGTEPSGFTSPSHSDPKAPHSPVDEPSELPSAPQASHKSNTEPSPNPLTADVGLPETVPPPLHLNLCEESPRSSSPSIDETARNEAPLTSTPLPEEDEDASFDQPHQELQYPKSLWDAVNRIRKHTAPDSENEEEEVSEQWDPDCTAGADLGCLDVVFVMNSGMMVFDKTESVEDVEQDPRHEEDTLSCSSHSSGDTIIEAEEEEMEEMPPDAVTESKTEGGEEFPAAEGERRCAGEAKDETADDDEGEEEGEGEEELIEGDQTELCLSGGGTAEMENTTDGAMKTTETEQKEGEEEGPPPSEVTVQL